MNNVHCEPLLIIVSGPSGVGKDAILNRLKDKNLPYAFITTATTRKRRNTEKPDVDYRFITVEEFQRLIENNGLLEWAQVYGNYYGVPKQPVKESLLQGKDTIIKVDIQGAATIKKKLPEAVFIFISPPSLEELARRLTRRNSETPADLSIRLQKAEEEMRDIKNFDYVVCNQVNSIDLAIEQIQAIIVAEKCRVTPRKVTKRFEE